LEKKGPSTPPGGKVSKPPEQKEQGEGCLKSLPRKLAGQKKKKESGAAGVRKDHMAKRKHKTTSTR